jgi:hypothetical protein
VLGLPGRLARLPRPASSHARHSAGSCHADIIAQKENARMDAGVENTWKTDGKSWKRSGKSWKVVETRGNVCILTSLFQTPQRGFARASFIIQNFVSHARWIVHASLYAVTLGLRFGQRLYYLSTVATCASSQTMQSICIRTQMAKEFVG